MNEDELRKLARAWWLSDGGDDAFEEFCHIVWSRQELVPGLIRAAVATAPDHGALSYIGTSVIEDIIDLYHPTPPRPMPGSPGRNPIEILREAELDRPTLFAVLSGAYAFMLSDIDIRGGLAGLLSDEQFAWLLDEEDAHRFAFDGVTVADGDHITFIPGATEWQRGVTERQA